MKFISFNLLLYGTAAYLIWDMLIRKKTVETDYVDYINVGKGVTYPEYMFKEFCDVLYFSMKNAGTYEEDILQVIRKLKTSADVRKLKEVWGTRDYSGGFGGNLAALMNPDVSLSGWFSLEGMTNSVNAVLKSKGIKERF